MATKASQLALMAQYTASDGKVNSDLIDNLDSSQFLRDDVDETMAGSMDFTGNGYVRLPAGTTAERPASPSAGMLRYNTEIGKLEQYSGQGAWQAIDSPPIVTSLAYSGGVLAADPAGGETVTVTGSNFTNNVTVEVDGTVAPSATVINSTTVQFTTPPLSAGDYEVTVKNNTGLGATLSPGITYNGTPNFTTPAGQVGDDFVRNTAIPTITIVAAEPDGGALSYSITSGALPSGISMDSSGNITGTTPATVGTTTYNFTVTATDDENQTNSRAFNLVVLRPVYTYDIESSVVFDYTENQYIERLCTSEGSRTTFTFSAWVKLGSMKPGILDDSFLVSIGGFAGDDIAILHKSYNDTWTYVVNINNGAYITAARFSDPTAWHHIVLQVDTTNATADDRVILTINGKRQAWASTTAVSQNHVTGANQAGTNIVIGRLDGIGRNWDGYVAEVNYIDGSSVPATTFGENYNGAWIPKQYSGSHGTNGFYLPMKKDTSVQAFNSIQYVGDSVHQYMNGVGFEPDMVWTKRLDTTSNHQIHTVVTGWDEGIFPNLQNPAGTSVNCITDSTSDGYIIAGESGNLNTDGGYYIGWCWDAGTASPATNNEGSISATVKSSSATGFGIANYIGNGVVGATVGHGMNQAPEIVMYKNLSATGQWNVIAPTLMGDGYWMPLNDVTSKSFYNAAWTNTSTHLVLAGGSGHNGSGAEHLALFWHSVDGISKIGSYAGTGANGNTITTGFKPAFVMFKRTDGSGNWLIFDDMRDNPSENATYLYGNGTNAQNGAGASTYVQFTDTGFTHYNNYNDCNASGATYIYMAFANTRDYDFWTDMSGNGNDFIPVNTSNYRVTSDTPTGN